MMLGSARKNVGVSVYLARKALHDGAVDIDQRLHIDIALHDFAGIAAYPNA